MAIFKDQRNYRLPKGGKLVMDRNARDQIRAKMMAEGVAAAAARIASRANAASSWGGYSAWVGRQSARVAVGSAPQDSSRARRLLALASGAAE